MRAVVLCDFALRMEIPDTSIAKLKGREVFVRVAAELIQLAVAMGHFRRGRRFIAGLGA